MKSSPLMILIIICGAQIVCSSGTTVNLFHLVLIRHWVNATGVCQKRSRLKYKNLPDGVGLFKKNLSSVKNSFLKFRSWNTKTVRASDCVESLKGSRLFPLANFLANPFTLLHHRKRILSSKVCHQQGCIWWNEWSRSRAQMFASGEWYYSISQTAHTYSSNCPKGKPKAENQNA